MSEISTNVSENAQKTPIEIALGMNDEGMVSAKKLYDFLELAPSQYSRWCKTNIVNNILFTKGIDYFDYEDFDSPQSPIFPVRHDVELEKSRVSTLNDAQSPNLSVRPSGELEKSRVWENPNPTIDYLLKEGVAKELCQLARNEKGKIARKYFSKTEDALRRVVRETVPQIKALQTKLEEQANLIKSCNTQLQEYKKENNARLVSFESRMNSFDSGLSISTYNADWINKQSERIKKLCKFKHYTFRQVCDDIEYMMHREYRETYESYKQQFKENHPGEKTFALYVCADYDLSRSWFIDCLIKVARDYGYYTDTEYVAFVEDVFGEEDEEFEPFNGKYVEKSDVVYEEEITDPEELARFNDFVQTQEMLAKYQK